MRGLLPDNDEVRRRWAAHFGLKDRDTFGLIAAIGSDAAGGAVFLSQPDIEQPDTGAVEPVAEADIAARLRRLRADPADWLGHEEHWSLAGAQSKFTLRRLPAGWGIAHGTQASTHIVKPGIASIPGHALVEHLSMVTVRSLGLAVANSEFSQFEDQSAIVVERFDRIDRDGTITRIHQEDFCQSFGMDPGRKYEADGGPGVQRIADVLTTTTDDDSVERFAQAVIVNYLLGAPDAHAKNYSVLLLGRTVRLAPLYDLASGLTADRDGALRYPKGAMSIGGERAFGAVLGRHWDRFAGRVGMPAARVRGWVSDYSEQVPDAVSDALKAETAAVNANPQVRVLLPRVRRLAELTRQGLDVNDTLRSGSIAHEIVGASGH